MTSRIRQTKAPDTGSYNSINTDFAGYRTLEDTEEIVEYHSNTSHRVWLNDLDEDYPTHWHNAMEIIMPVEGSLSVTCSSGEYPLEPGQMLFIPPRELHSIRHLSKGGTRFYFLMDISAISTLKGFVGIEAFFSTPLLYDKATSPLIYDDIYDILLQIRNEYYRNGEYTELSIQSLILLLFVKIGENHANSVELFPNVRPGKHNEYMQRFNQLLEYIDEHYMEDLNLDSIAAMAGFSKYHFSRLFKQYTDFTFCDYLSYRRIKAATKLLSEPDHSITEIAMESGFPSISTFNRLFKAQTGCTPREYRSKNTSKTNPTFITIPN